MGSALHPAISFAANPRSPSAGGLAHDAAQHRLAFVGRLLLPVEPRRRDGTAHPSTRIVASPSHGLAMLEPVPAICSAWRTFARALARPTWSALNKWALSRAARYSGWWHFARAMTPAETGPRPKAVPSVAAPTLCSLRLAQPSARVVESCLLLSADLHAAGDSGVPRRRKALPRTTEVSPRKRVPGFPALRLTAPSGR